MNNAIDAATELKLDGRTYHLLFDFEAVAQAEDATDQPLLTGLGQREVNHPRINLVRGMLYAGLLRHHPDISFAAARRMVTADAVPEIWGTILIAWAKARAKSEDGESADPLASRN